MLLCIIIQGIINRSSFNIKNLKLYISKNVLKYACILSIFFLIYIEFTCIFK